MSYKIKLSNGHELVQPDNYNASLLLVIHGRECIRFALSVSYEEAKAIFTEDVKYSQIWDSVTHVIDPETKEIVEVPLLEEQDLSEYTIPIEIADQLNGVVIVTMGKPTEMELLQAELADADAALAVLYGEET